MATMNPILNVIPISKNRADKTYTSPEHAVSADDTLPDEAPDFFITSVMQKRIFKWLRQHGLTKGVHKQIDALEMRQLAKAIADVIKTEEYLELHGETYQKEDSLGNTIHVAYPQVRRLEQLNREILNHIKILNLYPAARRALVSNNRRVTSDVNRWGT